MTCFCNTGGFGIDGGMSAAMGASLMNPDKLFFLVIGDLAFFYDLNSLGNRHLPNNLRILLVNNGKGTEFRNYNHPGARFGEDADKYIAAAGHFGNKSATLVKSYVESLGCEYLVARNKEEYLSSYKKFFSPQKSDTPIVFEVMTDNEMESDALFMLRHLDTDPNAQVKELARTLLGEKGWEVVKKLL